MIFGRVPLPEAAGGILAHSVQAGGKRFRKGLALTPDDVERLADAGIAQVTVARLTEEDVGENEAASQLADALLAGTSGLGRSAAFAGRANIYAELPGLVQLDVDAVTRLNGINPAITLATLPDLARVATRSLVATVKIISFGVPASDLAAAVARASGILDHMPVLRKDAALLVTRLDGQSDRLLEKGRSSIAARLARLGINLDETRIVPHEPQALADALAASRASLLLLLTGSATSDMLDVGPAGLRAAGGRVHRFGIPVDPGNLLFHGELGERPVIGLPGCARSPVLNGADWVLERIACGIRLTDHQFAAMGVGGLLKEIPSRPLPRGLDAGTFARPRVAVLILVQEPSAAPEGLAAAAGVAGASHAEIVRIVAEGRICRDLELAAPAIADSLVIAETADRSGLLKAGIASLADRADAVLLLRSGDPVPDPTVLNRMIAAFSPDDGREICRLNPEPGHKGPPMLFGKRFFESLSSLEGERGAAEFLPEVQEFLFEMEP